MLPKVPQSSQKSNRGTVTLGNCSPKSFGERCRLGNWNFGEPHPKIIWNTGTTPQSSQKNWGTCHPDILCSTDKIMSINYLDLHSYPESRLHFTAYSTKQQSLPRTINNKVIQSIISYVSYCFMQLLFLKIINMCAQVQQSNNEVLNYNQHASFKLSSLEIKYAQKYSLSCAIDINKLIHPRHFQCFLS